MPHQITAVIADPHTIKSKIPLPALTHASSPPSHGKLSFIKIEPLATRLMAWKAIPGVSTWILKTIEQYSLQFAHRHPRFRGVIQTSVSNSDSHVLRSEVNKLLAKGAIEQQAIPTYMFDVRYRASSDNLFLHTFVLGYFIFGRNIPLIIDKSTIKSLTM